MSDISQIFYSVGAAILATAITLYVFRLMTNHKIRNDSPATSYNLKTSESLLIDTVYLHKVFLSDINSAINLLKALDKKGIPATLIAKGGKTIVQFVYATPLKNVKELKSKGLIKNCEITEVFSDA